MEAKVMDWTSAETPPEMKKSEWWPESEPVLVYEADGTMRVATYEQVDVDSTPCWYSADNERWTLETVTHWMPLPPTPAMKRRVARLYERRVRRGSLKTDELLDVLESMARQHCHTDKDGMTDSGAITASAEALLLLEEHRRFRVKKDYGRMVCGYWPEHDPNVTPNAGDHAPRSGRVD